MESETIWYTGLNDYKKHILNTQDKTFSTEIVDQEVDTNMSIDAIVDDILLSFRRELEVLYSGGADSEFILLSCIKNKLPVTAITMVLKCNDVIINTHDLYYAEKFCRTYGVKQYQFTLDVLDFFGSGEYEIYTLPYHITRPHVATHFWLLEKCKAFPIIGGDWPWVQSYKEQKMLSPWKIDYSSYERFMRDKKIEGVGNLLSYNFDLSYAIAKKQMASAYANNGQFRDIHLLKKDLFPGIEPRIKSYGWENFPVEFFNIREYRVNLYAKIGAIKSIIKWNKKFKELLGSDIDTNNNNF